MSSKFRLLKMPMNKEIEWLVRGSFKPKDCKKKMFQEIELF